MQKEIRIAILDMYNGVPNEGMRCIKALVNQLLSQDGMNGNYEVFDVRGKNEVPPVEDFDIFISTGGPGSPLLEGVSWEIQFFSLLDQIFHYNKNTVRKKYLFLICHSFQLMAQHFELGVVTKRKSTSFGVMPIHLEPAGFDEPYFEGLDDPFWAVDSRDYQLIQPNLANFEKVGAKILALEKIRPHVPLERAIMAIRISDEIFATQFHPEADAEGMYRYFEREDKKQAVIAAYGEEKYYDMLDLLDDPDKIMLTEAVIIPRFLQHAADCILQSDNTSLAPVS